MNAAFDRAERFAKQSLDPVPFYALAVLFAHAHRHLYAVGGKIDYGQRAAMRALSRFEDFQKVLLLFQAQILHIRLMLCGNVLSALVSSSLERVSAALGLHALTESVHLASLALLGLIRSLHTILLFWKLNFFIFLIIGDFVRSVKQLCGVSDG